MAEHTPGPWEWGRWGHHEGHTRDTMWINGGSIHIGCLDGESRNPEADARLIAEAPALLAVLDRLTEVLGGMPTGTIEHAVALDAAYTAAIDAINKARGFHP